MTMPLSREMSHHMVDYGMTALGRAVVDVTFSEMGRAHAHAMAIVLAADAAEVLVKARIVQEHPLLMFDRLPGAPRQQAEPTAEDFMERGRSVAYRDLPNRVWATTGHRLERADEFLRFGELRNQVVHAAWNAPGAADQVLRFVFGVVEPLTLEFWGLSVVPFAQHWDDCVTEGYLQKRLRQAQVQLSPATQARLLVPGDSIEITSSVQVHSPDGSANGGVLETGVTLVVAEGASYPRRGGMVFRSATLPSEFWLSFEQIAAGSRIVPLDRHSS